MSLPENRIPIFAEGYLVEIRNLPVHGEYWQVCASGIVKELAEKRSHLIDQAKRFNKPQNLGELIIVDEDDLSKELFGYGEWNE
jgi:hypothetical protein